MITTLQLNAQRDVKYLQNLAIGKPFKSLAVKYSNARTPEPWQCTNPECLRIWLAPSDRIKGRPSQGGTGCPYCAGLAPRNIDWLIKIGQEHGQKFIGDRYSGTNRYYDWECNECGLVRKVKATNIAGGFGCPECAGIKKKDLKWLHNLPGKRAFISLAVTYNNSKIPVPWKCTISECGYEWLSSADTIRGTKNKEGSGCPKCSKVAPLTVSEIDARLKERDLIWVSGDFVKVSGKIKVRGICNHEWEATCNSIFSGHGCPKCAKKYNGEQNLVYNFVLELYPDAISEAKGLLNSKGLRLDIYIPSFKTAIEYDGWWCHKGPFGIKNGVPERDARKDKECIDAGIRLIRICSLEFNKNPKSILENLKHSIQHGDLR